MSSACGGLLFGQTKSRNEAGTSGIYNDFLYTRKFFPLRHRQPLPGQSAHRLAHGNLPFLGLLIYTQMAVSAAHVLRRVLLVVHHLLPPLR